MKRVLAVAFTIPLALLAACGRDAPPPRPADSAPQFVVPSSGAVPSGSVAPTGDPAARAAAMTDEELAGQVLMPYAYGSDANAVDEASAAANQKIGGVRTPGELVGKFKLGGLILVGFTADDPTGATNPTTNVENPEQVRKLTDGLQTAAPVPLLIGTDQEYGVVTRVKQGVTMLPSAMGLGAAGKPQLTEAAWKAAGTELAQMGINVDFAPVADTLGPQGSSVIGSRSYGDDPKRNADQVAAAVRGLKAAGVASALKHFPGHGHTAADSHDELPVVGLSRADWEKLDRPPFQAGIDAGAGLVMSGHLDVQALDKGVAATFSTKVMTDELRGKMRFGGVAVTDAMNMAPAMKWPSGEAAVRALNAGNDVLLMPPDLAGARDGILAGLKDGKLKRERLVEAVTRILALKDGLAPAPQLVTAKWTEHRAPVNAVAAASITVLKGRCDGPLVDGPVTVTASDGREVARSSLVKALQAAGVSVQAANGKIVHLVGWGDKRVDLNPDAEVTVMMDQPGLLASAKSPNLVATYSSSEASLTALAQVVAGKAKATGRSPVEVSGLPRNACEK